MSIAYRSDDVLVWQGDCIELMRSLPDACMDSVVTDPPYALEFMGKVWDRFDKGDAPGSFQHWCTLWATECFRLLKPGGHLLAFGGTRTWHRLTAGIEDAGFEIRDSIAWLSSKTFPKSRASLKGIFEPVVLAKKQGVLAGTPNIDGCRLPMSDEDRQRIDTMTGFGAAGALRPHGPAAMGNKVRTAARAHPLGRWPSNVVVDEDVAGILGERARFMYVTATRSERPNVDGSAHPTVKPLKLMEWLVRLVTPPGGNVLDPFAGSGTTVEACLGEGFRCMAMERETDYLPLILHRIDRHKKRADHHASDL